MNKKEERSFISKLDILSGTPRLFISGYKSYSTIVGLMTTILILLIGISYAIYAIYVFIFDREMTVVKLRDNFITTNLNVPTKDFLFAFNVFNVSFNVEYFSSQELNLLSKKDVIKEPINSSYIVKIFYENPETKNIINVNYLETEYCEIGKNINQDIIKKYNFTDYRNYLCISEKSNKNITINKTHNTYFDIIISLNTTNINRIEKKIISMNESSIIFSVNYFEFQMYTPNDIISNTNITNPINFRKNYYYNELISTEILKYNQITIKYIDYLSDKGIIFKKHEYFNGFSLESSQEITQPLGSFDIINNNTYKEFILYFNGDNIESYQRMYKKLPSIIADIQGVISILITIGKFLVEFLCKYYLEVDTMSKIFQSKMFLNPENELKQKSIVRVKNKLDFKTSQRMNDGLINNLSQKNVIIKSEDDKKDIKINMNNDKNNELSLINTDLSKNMLNIKNNYLEKRNSNLIIENDNNKNIESQLLNEDDKSNNIINNKKCITKINYSLYSETFIKILGVKHGETQKKCVNSNSFTSRDYLYFILNKRKNIKIKIIEKVSKFLENILSIEEITGRAIDLDIIISLIHTKFGKEFNLPNYMRIWLRKDSELKEILENENKQNNLK